MFINIKSVASNRPKPGGTQIRTPVLDVRDPAPATFTYKWGVMFGSPSKARLDAIAAANAAGDDELVFEGIQKSEASAWLKVQVTATDPETGEVLAKAGPLMFALAELS